MSMNGDIFLNTLYEGAVQTFHLYKILPSITAAQATLESNWGKSQLTQECYNLFGIKADSSWKGERKEYQTKEYDNAGTLYTTTAFFRKYDSYEESLQDHGEFFHQNKRYANVIGLSDYREQAHAIQDAGYATDISYAAKLIQIIEENRLQKWDQDVLENFVEKDNPDFDAVTHVVKEGETVSEIAQRYGKTVEEIVTVNQLSNPNLIYPEQTLVISPSRKNTSYYVVKEGDTLSSIAQQFGISVQKLVGENVISNRDYIVVGQKILITS